VRAWLPRERETPHQLRARQSNINCIEAADLAVEMLTTEAAAWFFYPEFALLSSVAKSLPPDT